MSFATNGGANALRRYEALTTSDPTSVAVNCLSNLDFSDFGNCRCFCFVLFIFFAIILDTVTKRFTVLLAPTIVILSHSIGLNLQKRDRKSVV